jgi:hypothetical protein
LAPARILVEKFKSIVNEIGYRQGMAIANYYLGLIENDAGNADRARENLEQAEKLAGESGDTNWVQTIREARRRIEKAGR